MTLHERFRKETCDRCNSTKEVQSVEVRFNSEQYLTFRRYCDSCRALLKEVLRDPKEQL